MADDIIQEMQEQLQAQKDALADIEEAIKLGEDADLVGVRDHCPVVVACALTAIRPVRGALNASRTGL